MILVEERMGAFALEYQRIRHGFDDLTIDGVPLPELTGHRARLADRVRRAVAAGRPIVLVPERAEEPSLAPPLGHWRREGDLYVLDPAPAAVSTASAPR
jgi:hypothetical protein